MSDVRRFVSVVDDDEAERESPISDEALSRARPELACAARVTSLGVLSASIVHEISQPLCGIITNANTCLRMLAAEPPNVEGARETARRTLRDGERVSHVISRLRSLLGNEDTTNEAADLNDAMRGEQLTPR
jgi:C4-dicarboxylate-specific signal transduction histidine kinase